MTDQANSQGKWTILDEAYAVLRSAVAATPVDGWDRKTPCSDWNVGQVLHHAVLDQLLYVSSISGTDKPEGDAFQPTGEFNKSASEVLQEALSAAEKTFDSVALDAEGVSVPLPPFSVSGSLAAGAAALDAAVHGWDIAVAAGQKPVFSKELSVQLLEVAHTLVEPLREWGAYAAAIEPAVDADDLARLLCFLGRDPNWTQS